MVSCISCNHICTLYFIWILTYYASKANDKPAYDLLRYWFLFWGPPMIAISLFVFLSLRLQNETHFYTAVFDYWWMFALSFYVLLVQCYSH